MWLRLPVCPFDLGMLVFLCPKPGSDRRRHENMKEESTMEARMRHAAAFDEEAMQ